MTFIISTMLTKQRELITLCCDQTIKGNIYSLQVDGNFITYLNDASPGEIISDLKKSLITNDHMVVVGYHWLWVISLKKPYPLVPVFFFNGIENASFDDKILKVNTGDEIESFTIDLSKSIWKRAWLIDPNFSLPGYYNHFQQTKEQKEHKIEVETNHIRDIKDENSMQISPVNARQIKCQAFPPSYAEQKKKFEATVNPPNYSDIYEHESKQETSAKENVPQPYVSSAPLINFSHFRRLNDYSTDTINNNELETAKTLLLETSSCR